MFAEDLTLFFATAEFASVATVGATSINVIFDAQDQRFSLSHTEGMSTEYSMTYATTAIGLVGGETVVINGVSYTARIPERIDDGALTRVPLSKV